MSRINHPPYYRADSGHEAEVVINAWKLGYHLGCVLKYVCRYGLKSKSVDVVSLLDNPLDDLDKAIWYLQRFRDLEAIRLNEENAEAVAELQQAFELDDPTDEPKTKDNDQLSLFTVQELSGSGISSPCRLT